MLFRSAIFAFVVLPSAALNASAGHATTLYVAANGGGFGSGSSCTVSAPCLNFVTALNAAAAGDTITCITPPAPGPLGITKSITIDCSGARAQIRDGGVADPGPGFLVAGITIEIAVSAGDPHPIVRLRGLTIDGGPHVLDRGIDIIAAAAVFIEDCVVSNNKQQGIFDRRDGGQTKLFVKDTIISGNAGAGIVAASAAVGITVLDNVTSENNVYGIAAGNGNNVEIRNSVFSGNSTAGVEADAGAHVVVRNSTISHNNVGVQSSLSVRIQSSDISFNNTAFSGSAATLGLNSYNANGSIGTTPSPIPGAQADAGP